MIFQKISLVWHTLRANERTRAHSVLVQQHYYAINHLRECLLKIETYPKSQSFSLYFFFSFFGRTYSGACNTAHTHTHAPHTVCVRRYGGPAHTYYTHAYTFGCLSSFIFCGIFVHIPLKMNDEFIGVGLHITHQAAGDVEKCSNRYRVSCVASVWAMCVLCSLPSFIVASPPLVLYYRRLLFWIFIRWCAIDATIL